MQNTCNRQILANSEYWSKYVSDDFLTRLLLSIFQLQVVSISGSVNAFTCAYDILDPLILPCRQIQYILWNMGTVGFVLLF